MPDPHPFDLATRLVPVGEGQFQGQTSAAYGNLVGPFGGVTSANLMQAVLLDARRAGDPISITVNFCAAIADGAFDIHSRLIRSGKYLQHWSLELHQGARICSTASIITAQRGGDFSHQPVTPPDVKAAADCAPLPGIPKFSSWLDRYDFRYIEGPPPMTGPPLGGLGQARSALWIRDEPKRALDYLSLTALSDSFLLRLFHVRCTMVPMGTVSLTTHFIASAPEVTAQGADPVLGVADALRFHGNFHDQNMQIWGGDGNLLATGTQMVWFKD